jgi:hypothetical protein
MAGRADIFPLLDQLAGELETARQHVLVAKQHAEGGQVPRFGAHMLAAEGHLAIARNLREQIAQVHSAHSIASAD